MNEALVYAGLCAAACGFAVCAPRGQRLAAFVVAVALNANWWICAWTYSASPPQAALGISAVDLWCLLDLSVGVSALVAGVRHWWGWALWFLAVGQECFHMGHFLLENQTYTFWLDKLLLAQVAVFVLIGGRRVSTWLLGVLGVHRLGSASKWGLAKVVRS